MKKYTICFTVLVLFLLQSCVGKGCHKEYAFNFPMTVTPQDTFSIGDTIWYEMNLPNEILDRNSGEYIDFTDFKLYFTFDIETVDSTTYVQSAQLDFDIVTDIGQFELVTNTFIYADIYTKSINEKHFRFGLIPKKSATYTSGINFPGYYFDLEDNSELNLAHPECSEVMITESTRRINNGAVNYHMVDGFFKYDNYDSTRYDYGTYDHYSNKGGYAFHVKP